MKQTPGQILHMEHTLYIHQLEIQMYASISRLAVYTTAMSP